MGISIGFFVLFGAFFLLASCAPGRSSIQYASQSINNALGCTDVKSKIFDALYETVDQDQQNLKAFELKSEVQSKIKKQLIEKKLSKSEHEIADQLLEQVDELLETMLVDAKDNSNIEWKTQIQKLIEYEMENESTDQNVRTHKKINQLTKNIKELSSNLDLSCQSSDNSSVFPGSSGSVLPDPGSSKFNTTSLYSGMNRVFTTLYQSCQVKDLPDMDARTPNVQGITRLAQNHPDGVGGKRVIGNLSSVQNTHYYIRGVASTGLPSCYTVRNNPPIYDYGGEPAVSNGNRTINLFKNAGTGTAALGVDCSAYVSSGIAAAGLRYKPDVKNKPIFIRQTSSNFINAKKSGFSCFDNVTVTPKATVKPGDIVSVPGHVVTIDKVGNDPFALRFVSNINGCNQLNYKDFDISVSQSSPSKGGIGVNKYKVKDYLDETGKMRNAFVQMGYNSCLAKFQNTNKQPISSDWGFIRHKGTTECMDEPISMVGESCVQQCW